MSMGYGRTSQTDEDKFERMKAAQQRKKVEMQKSRAAGTLKDSKTEQTKIDSGKGGKGMSTQSVLGAAKQLTSRSQSKKGEAVSTTGEVVGGASEGASVGYSVGGGWGAAAGAVIGGIKGAFKAKAARKKIALEAQGKKFEEISAIEERRGVNVNNALSNIMNNFRAALIR